MMSVQPAPRVDLSLRNSLILVFGIVVTAFLALGAHDLATAHLGVAYPKDGDVPAWARYVGQIVRLATMVCACHLASWYLEKRSTMAAAAIFGILIVLLQETFRVIVVGTVVTDGWTGQRWAYLLITRLPDALVYFYTGAIAVVIARNIRSDRPVTLLVAVAIASAIGYFGILPALSSVATLCVDALKLTDAPEVYQMPYGFYVYKYIYSTFLEPTIASFILVYLLWPSLQGSKYRRIGLFVLIMLLMRGRIVATGLFSFWIKGSLLAAFAAEGQFLVETLVLAALTGLTWAAITPRTGRGEDASSLGR